VTLRAYLQVLLKRWRIVVACTVLVLGAAATLTYLTPPTYAANATAFVSISSAGTADASIYQSSQFAMQRVKSYTEAVKSPSVLQPVIDKLDLPMTVRDLRSVVSAENPVDTVLIKVTATDRSAQRAQAIVNAVSDQLGVVIERLETPRDGGQPPVKVTTTVPSLAPQSPISPRVPLNMALGLLAGLALGVIVAVIREQQDTTIKGDELEDLTGRQALALIGLNPQAGTHPLITMEGHGRGVEEFRSLRTTLQFVDVDQPPRAIVITSALAAEGKTTTACNLAIALAQSSLRVCLVEADMRRPAAATLMGIDGSIGLSNVVAGQIDLADALMPWHRGLLTILPAGTPPPDPTRRLGSKNMAAVLATLRADFDFVIIDAPPILPVSDAAVLARNTDGAVLVARYGKTRREQLTHAIADLEAVKARLIGIALTMVPARGQRDLRGHDEDYAAMVAVSEIDWPVAALAGARADSGSDSADDSGSDSGDDSGDDSGSDSGDDLGSVSGDDSAASASPEEPVSAITSAARAASRPLTSLDPRVAGTSFAKSTGPAERGSVR
jgi:capsular exopolysaccharide synthesis family protein